MTLLNHQREIFGAELPRRLIIQLKRFMQLGHDVLIKRSLMQALHQYAEIMPKIRIIPEHLQRRSILRQRVPAAFELIDIRNETENFRTYFDIIGSQHNDQ